MSEPYLSKIAHIWDFEKTNPNASAEERLNACLMRERITDPYWKVTMDKLEKYDHLKACCEKLAEALAFYAQKKHARFLGEIDDGLVRTTRVEGCVEVGYRARKALAEYRTTFDQKASGGHNE